MWRISKETTRIKSIKRGDYEIDSVIIIPGVCSYETIYTKQNFIYFSNSDYNKSIVVEFVFQIMPNQLFLLKCPIQELLVNFLNFLT